MKLTEQAIQERLAELAGWSYEDAAVVRTFTFKSFPDAIAFVTRLAFAAEAADHHPDLTVSYRRVTVTWSTHSAGGVTEKDLIGVATTDAVAAGFVC